MLGPFSPNRKHLTNCRCFIQRSVTNLASQYPSKQEQAKHCADLPPVKPGLVIDLKHIKDQ